MRKFYIIPRRSVEQFIDSNLAIPALGKRTGAKYILEGSVQSEGEKARIQVSLVNAIRDRQVWAERFEQETGNMLEQESEIAWHIAGKLQTTFSKEEMQMIKEMPARNIEACNIYLQGRSFLNKSTYFWINRSIETFKMAIAKDSTFALAYSALA